MEIWIFTINTIVCIELNMKKVFHTIHRIFNEENSTYEYRPRGFHDYATGAELPYPEVIAYKENADRTIMLTVNAVWPEKHLEKEFSHEVVVRPLKNGGVQYVSNHVIPADENVEPAWYMHRLTIHGKRLVLLCVFGAGAIGLLCNSRKAGTLNIWGTK